MRLYVGTPERVERRTQDIRGASPGEAARLGAAAAAAAAATAARRAGSIKNTRRRRGKTSKAEKISCGGEKERDGGEEDADKGRRSKTAHALTNPS